MNHNKEKKQTAVEPKAISIGAFCAAHAISRSGFYNLLAAGTAPKTIRIGRRRLVTVEAAEEWLQQMEARSAHQNAGASSHD